MVVQVGVGGGVAGSTGVRCCRLRLSSVELCAVPFIFLIAACNSNLSRVMFQRLALISLFLFALSVGLVLSTPVDPRQVGQDILKQAQNCSDNIADCLGGPVSVRVVCVLE